MSTFDYTARDFTNIKNDLLRRASRVAPDWSTRDPSDFGMLLVDLWAQMGDVMHYYIDRAAGESFLVTAKQRESVLAYASMFGYVPYGRRGSTGTITLANSTSSDYTIPKYTTFIGQDSTFLYNFYVNTETVIPAFSNGTTVPVTEGTRIDEETLTPATGATGNINQMYTLAYPEVDTDTIRVTVYEDGTNPIPYSKVDRLTDAPSGSRIFRLKYDAKEFTQIVFGGAGIGLAPASGVQIKATYAITGGAKGNLAADSITDFGGAPPIGISIVTSSAMTGGRDAEPVTALRSRIPTAFTPQGRVVTQTDYANTVRGVSSVAKVVTSYASASAGNASVTVYPQIDRSADFVSTNAVSQTVTSDVSTDVINSLKNKRMMGVDVVVASTITWTPIYLEVTAYVSDNYYASTVKKSVEDTITSFFGFNNVVFGELITLGDVYRRILDVKGLDYAIITKFNTNDSASVSTSIQIASTALPKITFGATNTADDTVVVTTSGGIAL